MKRQLETLEMEGGNTKPPPLRTVPSKRWTFTYNNPPEDAVETVETVLSAFDIEYIFGEEVGEEGTPHLQGYLEAPVKIRPIEKLGLDKKIHWEKAKGNKAQNLVYCAKDGKYHHSAKMRPIRPVQLMKREFLRDDQKEIVDLFKDYEDPLWGRNIYWFWEPTGNWGKSVVATHLVDFGDAIEVSGAAKDVFCGIAAALEDKDIKTVVFDIPRRSVDYVQYQAIEKLKDGKFFSPKYESGMKRFNKPHIVCFANQPPDVTGMSLDRWIIERLDSTEEIET